MSKPISSLDSLQQESAGISTPAGHRDQLNSAKSDEGKGNPVLPVPFPSEHNIVEDDVTFNTLALPNATVPSSSSSSLVTTFGSITVPNNQQNSSFSTDSLPNIGDVLTTSENTITVGPMSSAFTTLISSSTNSTTAVLYSSLLVPKNLPLSNHIITISLFSAFSIITGCLAVASIFFRSRPTLAERDPSSLYANSVRRSRERRAKTDINARKEFILSTSPEGTASRFTAHSDSMLRKFPLQRPDDGDEEAPEPREDTMFDVDLS